MRVQGMERNFGLLGFNVLILYLVNHMHGRAERHDMGVISGDCLSPLLQMLSKLLLFMYYLVHRL